MDADVESRTLPCTAFQHRQKRSTCRPNSRRLLGVTAAHRQNMAISGASKASSPLFAIPPTLSREITFCDVARARIKSFTAFPRNIITGCQTHQNG